MPFIALQNSLTAANGIYSMKVHFFERDHLGKKFGAKSVHFLLSKAQPKNSIVNLPPPKKKKIGNDCQLECFFPVLVCCTKKKLATLVPDSHRFQNPENAWKPQRATLGATMMKGEAQKIQ
jgi:hypothetical protein